MPAERGFDAVFVAETDLTEDRDAALRRLLAAAFPERADHLAVQSWWLARPQWRLWLAAPGGEPVAHLGIERRRIGVGAEHVYVAGVGHVCTAPALRGQRLGARLLAELRPVVEELLRLPYALLTCGEQVAGFYQAGGWTRLPGPVTKPNLYTGERLVDAVPAVMVLGGTEPVDRFPPGRPIDLRGLPW